MDKSIYNADWHFKAKEGKNIVCKDIVTTEHSLDILSKDEVMLSRVFRGIDKSIIQRIEHKKNGQPIVKYIAFKKKIGETSLPGPTKEEVSLPIITPDMTWNELIKPELNQQYMIQLQNFLRKERETKEIYPESNLTFNAFKLTPYQNVKVVIVGQDPYFTPNTAHGLAFSSLKKTIPPSLKIIFAELAENLYNNDLMGFSSADLTSWAKQGVLLMNQILTVESGIAMSHKNRGWEIFTSKIISFLDNHPTNSICFMFWGKNAKQLATLVKNKKHMVLQAAHPAAEIHKKNAGFYGCGHFTKAQEFVEKNYNTKINWLLF